MDRKKFIKRSCLSGLCICGLSAVSFSAAKETPAIQDDNQQVYRKWLSDLLANMNRELDEEALRSIVKKSFMAHYNDLNMDSLLAGYAGDTEGFIRYVESNWGWKVEYDKAANVIIADENKDYCVCPVLDHIKGQDTSAICYCSEGFTEKMFSVVTGGPVTARVISSVRKGDTSCRYRIETGQTL